MCSDALDFSAKTVLVTGAASGIGRAVADAFLRCGARVVVWDVDRKKLDEAFSDQSVDRCMRQCCDVGDALQVAACTSNILVAWGPVDVLINNAGIIHSADFLDLTEEDFDRVLRVNLKGMFLVGQAIARMMVAHQRPGAVVNISSVNAVMAIANQVPYTISKGGVNQLTKVMALSLAPYEIRVNGIGPGSIMTDILKGVAGNPEAQERILSRTPLGRVGEPEEIAEIALFLSSPMASYITGQVVYADGGRLALNYTMPVRR